MRPQIDRLSLLPHAHGHVKPKTRQEKSFNPVKSHKTPGFYTGHPLHIPQVNVSRRLERYSGTVPRWLVDHNNKAPAEKTAGALITSQYDLISAGALL